MNTKTNGIEEDVLRAEIKERTKLFYKRLLENDVKVPRRNPHLWAAILKYRIAPEVFEESKLSQGQVARMCRVSTSRVGQVEQSVVDTLKRFLEKETSTNKLFPKGQWKQYCPEGKIEAFRKLCEERKAYLSSKPKS